MPMLTTKEINEIRNSVDIVKIIGEFIPLTKKGRNFLVYVLFMMIIIQV